MISKNKTFSKHRGERQYNQSNFLAAG